MRIDVKKFLFIGLEEERAAFFKKAQEFGVVQFIGKQSREIPADLQKLQAAMKILRELKPTEQEELEDYDLADGIVDRIVELKEREEALLENQRVTKLEIARVSIFGHFSIEDIRALDMFKFQFFCGKEGVETDPNLIYIGTGQGLDYYLSIAKKEVHFDRMIEMQIEEPLGVLERRVKENELRLREVEEQLKKYAKFNTFLHHAFIHKLNGHQLAEAQNFPQGALEGALFAVEGWIPVDKEHLLKDLDVHFEEIAVTEKDTVPTYLENQGLNRLGEDLVHLYDTPSSTDKDPSLWVLGFFALFFAMIIGDAGYGLIYLLTSLYLYKKVPKVTKAGRRFVSIALILCGTTLLWGVLVNSFFGMSLSHDNPLRKYSMLQWLVSKKAAYHFAAKDSIYQSLNLEDVSDSAVLFKDSHEVLNTFSNNIMMEIALLVGVVHVCISMLRYLDRNLVSIGWIMAIIGAYLYIPHYMQATTMMQYLFGLNREALATQGVYLFTGGTVLAVALSIFYNRLSGLLEIMQVIQIFSDVLSYLRLYALGLAGAIIASTVNEIAGSIGFVFGTLLLIIGHSINMGLSIMGGVLHGLRLIFLEWYHYCFQGGGKQFSPLCKVEIE